MERNNRLKVLKDLFSSSSEPLQGKELAQRFGVSRQAIVQDVALLRSRGFPVHATPRGYCCEQGKERCRRLFAVIHSKEEIARELFTVVDLGGRIVDVLVEHSLYGEIRGNIDVSNREDAVRFVSLLESGRAEPLLVLSGGVHLHTLEAESEEKLNAIEKALDARGYLLVSPFEHGSEGGASV